MNFEKLYYFKNYNEVTSLYYDFINELINKSIVLNKEKDFNIC